MSDAIAEAIREHWGEKCGEFEPECPTCQVWAEFAELSRLSALVAWQDIEAAPKNTKVLAGYWNSYGKWRTVTACYHTQLAWADDVEPEDDSEYAPSGWYEESETHDNILLLEYQPTHFKPLPAPPVSQLKDTTNADNG